MTKNTKATVRGSSENQTFPMVVIVGETATGKSSLAMQVAKKHDGEIISADSWTVYRGFDIGTAKPNAADLQSVKHHLVDIVDAGAGFSAAEFKRQASEGISDIRKRQKLPILVGGTGLYVDSIVFDYGFLPAGSVAKRDQLNQLSIDELLGQIQRAGISVEGIDTRNKRRLVRLIETGGKRPTKKEIRPNTLMIGLKVPPEELKRRITSRTDEMLLHGLENEVRKLAGQYGWDVEPMKGIGYREFKKQILGAQDIIQTRDQIIASSLKLAKKQRTWFQRNKSIHWIDDPSKAFPVIDTFLNTVH